MPRERFEALCRYIHLNDSTRMPGRDDANHHVGAGEWDQVTLGRLDCGDGL